MALGLAPSGRLGLADAPGDTPRDPPDAARQAAAPWRRPVSLPKTRPAPYAVPSCTKVLGVKLNWSKATRICSPGLKPVELL
jgi:hypothetical protein